MEKALAYTPSIDTRDSRAQLWIGRVLTGLIVTFLLVDALGKLALLAPVVEGSAKVGLAFEAIRPLGAVLAVSTLLHVIPRTQFLGAVLVTAYLGGAVATHVFSGTPFWFAVVMGVLLWVAYALRNAQLRELVLAPRK